ncbi:MAG: FecR domain-containing protein [Acidobacteria bacterium]|nr:FecR domain-containing protein [Acidobacteriota bacterium]
MDTKVSRFKDLDWWIVPKRLIYIVAAIIALSLVAGGAGVYLWIHGNPFKGDAAEAGAPAGARFITFEGGVRVVRANTREVTLARSDTRLFPGDIVQTQEDGRARISFADGSTFFVKPDSVMTIAENTGAEDGKSSKVRVVVESGQVNVRTEQQPESASNVVATQLTESRVNSETDASFDVRGDKSEAIRVSTGKLETSTRNGDVTTLQGGDYAAVNPLGSIAQKERLLAAPAPVTPRNLERIPARKGSATSVPLRWQRPAVGAPAHYRVEVATSPFFVTSGKLVERDQLQATEFTVDSLRQGNYFWRVLAVAPSGQTSDWSEPQKFVVETEGGTGESVGLSDVTVDYVAGSIYVIRGRTEAGNTVRGAGRETLASRDGSFQLQVNAQKGARDIAIEVADTQGNHSTARVPLPPGTGQQ